MDGVKVQWEWNPDLLVFVRSQDDTPHVDIDDVRVNAKNVVLIFAEHSKSGISPVAKSVGSGEAWVYTAGVLVQGSWERLDATVPFSLKDASGAPIDLTPGRTWVEVVRKTKAAHVPAGIDPASVKYP